MKILALLLAALILFLWYFRSKLNSRNGRYSRLSEKLNKKRIKKKRVTNKPYRAVSINSMGTPCAAVESFETQRFLVNEAPLVPLPGCNSSQCNCRYVHHRDRRGSNVDRRAIRSAGASEYAKAHGKERRTSRVDRRHGDPALA